MAQLASFKAFLNTGRLGPLHHGLSLNEVATLLGPPKSWIVNEGCGLAPNLWTYDLLEASFPPTLDRCDWFQIKSAFRLLGEAVAMADGLMMTLDGLSADSPVSAFIKSVDDVDRVRFYISIFPTASSPVMWIDESVELWFEERGDDVYDAFKGKIDQKEMINLIEKKTRLSCIFWYPPSDHDYRSTHRQMREKVEHLRVTGREFLAALG